MDLLSQMLRRLMQKDPRLSVVAWLFPLGSWWSLAFPPWLGVYPRAGRELKSGIVPLNLFGLVLLAVTVMARALRLLKVPSACAYGNHSSPYHPTSKGHLSIVQWGGMVEISWAPAFSPGMTWVYMLLVSRLCYRGRLIWFRKAVFAIPAVTAHIPYRARH